MAAAEPNSPGSTGPGGLADHCEPVCPAVHETHTEPLWIDNLQQLVNEQQNLLAHQTREINLLKTDSTYLETVARDRLDLMKEGETIFRLEPARAAKPKPNNSARR